MRYRLGRTGDRSMIYLFARLAVVDQFLEASREKHVEALGGYLLFPHRCGWFLLIFLELPPNSATTPGRDRSYM